MGNNDNSLYSDDALNKLHDVYSLWWQYLYQSFWYNEFCREIHEAKIKIDIDEIPDSILDEIEEKFDSIYLLKKNQKSKFNPPPHRLLLKSYWNCFGDIYNNDFENRWDNKIKYSLREPHVIDLRKPDAIDYLPPFHTPLFRQNEGRLTDEEMLSMITRDSRFVFVAIPAWNLTVAEIGKQINFIREKHKEEYQHPPMSTLAKGTYMTLEGRQEIEEIERYLKYFKLKIVDKLTEDEIIKKRDKEEEDIANSNNLEYCKIRKEIQDMIGADIKKAEKIIRNVEMGIFPGSYQPDKKRSKKRIS